MPDIRVAVYPGAIAVHPLEEVEKNIREVVFPQVIKLLTEPIAKAAASADGHGGERESELSSKAALKR